jgi:hypothetical protein
MKPSPFFVLLSSVIPVPAMVMTDPHIRLSIHFQVAQFHLFRGSPAKKDAKGCSVLHSLEYLKKNRQCRIFHTLPLSISATTGVMALCVT